MSLQALSACSTAPFLGLAGNLLEKRPGSEGTPRMWGSLEAGWGVWSLVTVATRSSLVGTAFRGAWRLASGAEAWSSHMPAWPDSTAAVRTCKTQDTETATAALQGDTLKSVSIWPMLRLMALSEAVPRSGSKA